jgi:hypothetical protein
MSEKNRVLVEVVIPVSLVLFCGLVLYILGKVLLG